MRILFALFFVVLAPPALAGGMLPDNFLEVSPGIFRSAQPDLESLSEVQRQFGIKTIINLNNDDEAMSYERKWTEALGIREISQPMSAFFRPDDRQVNEILADLANPANYPVLVHCQHGEDRTGLIIGLHRVLREGWAAERAYDEMLDRGFHTILFPLDDYFHDRTGWLLTLP